MGFGCVYAGQRGGVPGVRCWVYGSPRFLVWWDIAVPSSSARVAARFLSGSSRMMCAASGLFCESKRLGCVPGEGVFGQQGGAGGQFAVRGAGQDVLVVVPEILNLVIVQAQRGGVDECRGDGALVVVFVVHLSLRGSGCDAGGVGGL